MPRDGRRKIRKSRCLGALLNYYFTFDRGSSNTFRLAVKITLLHI